MSRPSAIGSCRCKCAWSKSKGEYTGWRATRATGDFDLRTFKIRAYPIGARGRLAARHERLHRLAERTTRDTARGQDCSQLRLREVRWIGRDPVARFLLFGVPVIAFALLGFTFSDAVVRGLDVVVVDMDNSATSRLFVQTSRPHLGSRLQRAPTTSARPHRRSVRDAR